MQFEFVQTFLAGRIAEYLSEKTNSTVKIDNFKFTFFNNIKLDGLYIADEYQDTLVYIKKINADITYFNLTSNNIRLGRVDLEEPYVKIISYNDSTINILRFIDALGGDSTKTTSSSYFFLGSKIKLKNGRFVFKDYKKDTTKYAMKYGDLDFYNINSNISQLHNIGDSIKMDISDFNCKEKCGLKIKDLRTKMAITNSLLRFFETHIKTNKSIIDASLVDFSYKPNTHAWSNFITSMNLDYRINKSKISFDELAFFNDNLKGYNQVATVSGRMTGTIYNMSCKDVIVDIYQNTRLEGDVSMTGLPNIDETFFDARIKSLVTSLDDLERIKIPNYMSSSISFPKTIQHLGKFKYKGKYTGFLSDFVFYGHFQSDFGYLNTDISVKPKTKTNKLELQGNIKTEDFNIGGLLSSEALGYLSMNINVVNAATDNKNKIKARIKGEIDKLELYKYPYSNIIVDAFFANNIFDGYLSLNDKNIDCSFTGHINANKTIPKMNFVCALNRANLVALNLNQVTQDSISNLSFKLETNLSGGSLDDFQGNVGIDNLHYANSKGSVKPKNISLSMAKLGDKRISLFKSDFMDVNFSGNYKLSELTKLPYKILSPYLSKLALKVKGEIKNEKCKLTAQFKEITPILSIFTPDYQISNNSSLSANYELGENYKCNIDFAASQVLILGNKLYNVNFKSTSKDSLISNLNIGKVEFKNKIALYNLNLKNAIGDNQINTNIDWANRKQSQKKGSIILKTEFIQNENGYSEIVSQFGSSKLYMPDEYWSINNSKIVFRNNNIFIDKLKIMNKNNDYIQLCGMLSKNKNDSIYVGLNNFDIKYILGLAGMRKIGLSGKLSGFTEYKSNKNKYTLIADLKVPKLLLGKDNLGELKITYDWDRKNQKLYADAFLLKDNNKYLSLKGYYWMSNDKIDYMLKSNNTKLNHIESQLSKYISNIDGIANGNIHISGTVAKPKVNGGIELKIPKLTLQETGVSYKLYNTINVNNNQLIFNHFKITDERYNPAVINGKIDLNIGSQPYFDLGISTSHLSVLQSKYKHLAYGDGHISSSLYAKGVMNNLDIKGKISIDDHSKIIIPFNRANAVSDNNFVTFIDPLDSIDFVESGDILFNSPDNETPITFDVDLDINPTSEIQLLFEAKSGSVIKSKGSASLRIRRDDKNKQHILGEYTISQGSFLYSLKGLVNKKFILKKGGKISWYGTPEDAYIDIEADYKIKASISPLLAEESSSNKNYNRQTNVVCRLYVTGKLENPKLTFKIEFPNLDNMTMGKVESSLQTSDITKQVLSLLIFNRFSPLESIASNSRYTNSSDALSVTTSELISSQLSNILAQISDDVNIGFIYKPGDDLTNKELGLAISTELLKNRVVISSNLGFASDSNEGGLNNFVGDVDLDVKIDKKGKLRIRAFSHEPNNLYYDKNRSNTQGIGLLYSDDFNTFKELINRYKQKLGIGRKNKKK